MKITEGRAAGPRRAGESVPKARAGVKRQRANSGTNSVPEIKFTAGDIVLRRVDELKPFPNNPKEHTPAQIEAIALNMREFGFDQPVLIDESDTILKGHGRSLAAPKAGFELVPTILRAGLTDAQKWAIVISDNALPAMTGFDNRLLKVGLTFLAKHDYPLKLTGFDNVRLATFGGAAPGAGPDDMPDIEPAISKRGDVWLLGDHRLMCGDSTNPKTVQLLLGDDDPDLMACDPPYNFETRGGGIHKKASTKHAQKIGEANLAAFEVSQLCALRKTNVIFTGKDLLADYLDLAREKGLGWDVAVLHRQAALPNHNGHLMSDLDYVVLMGKLVPQRGLEHQEYSKLFSMGHWDRPVPWAKPVDLMARILKLYSAAGAAVFEPYCGSGTTIIAAEMLGRRCLAIELNPEFVDLAVRRWEKFSGKHATLQGSKLTFSKVSNDRRK